MNQKLRTLPEAAQSLRMPISTFRLHRPAIGGTKLGKHWLFTDEELTKFIESKRSKPVSELKTPP